MKVLNQKGAAAVEMAIVTPLLFMILFGIIEFGLLLYDKAMLTNASREAARRAILYVDTNYTPLVTPEEIKAIVDNYVNSYMITFDSSAAPPTTCVRWTSESYGESITVEVTYTYSFLILPAFATGLLPDLVLRGQTIMRCEGECV